MRDATGIVFAFLMVFVAVALFLGTVRVLRRRQTVKPDEVLKREREEQTRLRKLIDAGTHVLTPSGEVAPKCFGCDAAATERPYEWARDEGLSDLIRRGFGAPRSVRIEQASFGEPVSCSAHLPLLRQLFKLDLGQQETERAKLESEHETRRARFQREGVFERAREEIAKHNLEAGGRRRRKSEAPNKVVVPFVSARSTGTDSR